MANVYDQLDPKAASSENVYDQLDPKKSAPPPEPVAETPKGGAFFGLPAMLPEAIQKRLPSFLTGPSVGEQLTREHQREAQAVDQAGNAPISLGYRKLLETTSPLENPVAGAFGTRSLGAGGIPGANRGAPDVMSPVVAVPVPSTPKIKAPYQMAVKPSVGAVRAAGGINPYIQKALSGVSSIIDNKDNLRFLDENGNVTSGELPKSLEQFSDAIDQTKQHIFDEYDALAQKSGATGIHLDLNPVVDELRKIAADKVTQDLHPELASYAESRADALMKRGEYSAPDAQQAVRSLNSTLKSFYRNPDYALAHRATIDALVANKLRAGLDDLIEKTVAPGYQDLKNQYGALKTIERDVANRAIVKGRQEAGGGILGRIADVASADEVIRGVFSLSPTAIARGVTLKAWAQYVKRLRDPDRNISKMFESAEQALKPPAVPTRLPVPPMFLGLQ